MQPPANTAAMHSTMPVNGSDLIDACGGTSESWKVRGTIRDACRGGALSFPQTLHTDAHSSGDPDGEDMAAAARRGSFAWARPARYSPSTRSRRRALDASGQHYAPCGPGSITSGALSTRRSCSSSPRHISACLWCLKQVRHTLSWRSCTR
jgi:hypothetical protein